jgi:hypothetical protein
MVAKTLPVKGVISFERMKKLNDHGAEYWSARELQPLLGYSQWRRFEEAIKRAMISCGQSGNVPENHFAGAGKMVELGSGSVNSQQQAIHTHDAVGKEVREAIKRIGGVMPENVPPAEHIIVVEKRIKSTPPILELEEKDAKGLVGQEEENLKE